MGIEDKQHVRVSFEGVFTPEALQTIIESLSTLSLVPTVELISDNQEDKFNEEEHPAKKMLVKDTDENGNAITPYVSWGGLLYFAKGTEYGRGAQWIYRSYGSSSYTPDAMVEARQNGEVPAFLVTREVTDELSGRTMHVVDGILASALPDIMSDLSSRGSELPVAGRSGLKLLREVTAIVTPPELEQSI